ncbi:GNAT family N-acetyltransferase [Glutamicibacter endophyticus]
MHSPWPVELDSVTLRYPTAGDIEQVLAFRNLPEVNRFMIRTSVEPEQLRRELQDVVASERDYSCVAVRGDTVVAIGFLELHDAVGQPGKPLGTEAVVGYLVHPEYWGQRIGSDLVPALLEVAFSVLGLRRVTATCSAPNVASARLLAGAGMRLEARRLAEEWHAELGWLDGLHFAMLAEEWHQRNTQVDA